MSSIKRGRGRPRRNPPRGAAASTSSSSFAVPSGNTSVAVVVPARAPTPPPAPAHPQVADAPGRQSKAPLTAAEEREFALPGEGIWCYPCVRRLANDVAHVCVCARGNSQKCGFCQSGRHACVHDCAVPALAIAARAEAAAIAEWGHSESREAALRSVLREHLSRIPGAFFASSC